MKSVKIHISNTKTGAFDNQNLKTVIISFLICLLNVFFFLRDIFTSILTINETPPTDKTLSPYTDLFYNFPDLGIICEKRPYTMYLFYDFTDLGFICK